MHVKDIFDVGGQGLCPSCSTATAPTVPLKASLLASSLTRSCVTDLI